MNNLQRNKTMQRHPVIRYKPLVIRLFCVCFLFMQIHPVKVFSQKSIPANEICSEPEIHTILLYRTGWDLSFPVKFFGEDDKLSLRFDHLGEPEEDYYYSVTACTYDWKITENPEHMYLDGFNNNLVDNKYNSFNTTKYYAHYSTDIPSEDMRFLTSGNYILRVYKSSEPDTTIFTRRFCLAERKAEINARVKQPDDQNQELEIEIDLKKLDIVNPMGEIKVVVIKNKDWNNQVHIAFKPVLRDKKLFLDLPYQVYTGGGNEFRSFNIKSTKYISIDLDSIKYISPETHFYLKPDILKQYEPYFSSTDINGRFYIDISDAHDRHTEADYAYVHFMLESPQAFASDVYIYGALTNWETNKSNCMIYDSEKGVYEKTLLLKQGYYNYAYAIRDYSEQKIAFDYTEGNHSETENEYLIFVYEKQIMSDFDRLVGYKIVNSTGEER